MRTPQGRICCEKCWGTAITHDTRNGGHAFVPSESESADERTANIAEATKYMPAADAERMMYGASK